MIRLLTVACIWILTTFVVVSAQCPTPVIQNGNAEYRTNSMIRIMCNSGFTLVGQRYLKCGEIAMCLKAGCDKLANSIGDLIYSTDGLSVTLRCPLGSRMTGANVAYCDGTRWSRVLGSCRPVGPATSLDFETADLGGWKSSASLNTTQWKQRKASTANDYEFDSGPRHDHTVAQSIEGTYLVTQVRNLTKSSVVEFISPVFRATLSRNACFRLWYCSYGAPTGRLRVSVRGEKSTKEQLLFETSGIQILEWHKAIAAINEVDENFYIVIEAVRLKNTSFSEISVDDIALLQGDADCRQNPIMVSTKAAEQETLSTKMITSTPTYFETQSSSSQIHSMASTDAAKQQTTTTENTTYEPNISTDISTVRESSADLNEPILSYNEQSTTIRTAQSDADYASAAAHQDVHKFIAISSLTVGCLLVAVVLGVVLGNLYMHRMKSYRLNCHEYNMEWCELIDENITTTNNSIQIEN